MERQASHIQESLVWGGLIGISLFAIYIFSSGLSFLEAITIVVLTVLCVVPMLRWYLEGMRWIPLGEGFVALHLIYYVLPCLWGQPDWRKYPESQHLMTLTAIGLFLIVFLAAYYAVLRARWRSLEKNSVLHNEVPLKIVWFIFCGWLVASAMLKSNILVRLGPYLNVYFTILHSLEAMAVVYLFYQIGRGKLTFGQRVFVFGGVAVGLLINVATGFLQGNVQVLGAALLAYALGSKRIPVLALVVMAFLLAVLQLGKKEYRDVVWNGGGPVASTSLMDGYKIWLEAGFRNLWVQKRSSKSPQSLLERTSLIQVLVRAMNETPSEKPFLNGKTYWLLPEQLVPRILWPNKPRGTQATEMIGIYYGIQTEKNAKTTGIAVGSLTEAWANFGWSGVAFSAAFFGLLFGSAARVSVRLVPSQVGWLLAGIVFSYSLRMEYCIAEMCTSMAQALLLAGVLLFFFSRPPALITPRRVVPRLRRPPSLRPAIR